MGIFKKNTNSLNHLVEYTKSIRDIVKKIDEDVNQLNTLTLDQTQQSSLKSNTREMFSAVIDESGAVKTLTASLIRKLDGPTGLIKLFEDFLAAPPGTAINKKTFEDFLVDWYKLRDMLNLFVKDEKTVEINFGKVEKLQKDFGDLITKLDGAASIPDTEVRVPMREYLIRGFKDQINNDNSLFKGKNFKVLDTYYADIYPKFIDFLTAVYSAPPNTAVTAKGLNQYIVEKTYVEFLSIESSNSYKTIAATGGKVHPDTFLGYFVPFCKKFNTNFTGSYNKNVSHFIKRLQNNNFKKDYK